MTTRKEKISITDIAVKFKVSVTTISFILNGKAAAKKISPSLIRRVEEYVKKVGYVPASVKRKLQAGDSECIGIIISDFFSEKFVSNLIDLLVKLGYTSAQFILKNNKDYDESVLQVAFDAKINSFICVGVLPVGVKDKLLRNSKQLFLVGEQDSSVDSICFEFSKSSYAYLKGVFESKKERVGLVMDSNLISSKEVMKGYMKAVEEFAGDLLIKKINMSQDQDTSLNQILGFVTGNDLQAVLFTDQKLLEIVINKIQDLGTLSIVSFAQSNLFKLINVNIQLLSVNEKTLLSDLELLLANKLSQKNEAIVNLSYAFEII